MSAYYKHTPVADSPSLLLFVPAHSEEVCEYVISFESDENKQCNITKVNNIPETLLNIKPQRTEKK